MKTPKFNKFQNTIIKRVEALTKHNLNPKMIFCGNHFAVIMIPIIREGRKGIHFMEFTKTSKSTISAKCFYEFSDDYSTMIAPIMLENDNKMYQMSNPTGIFKLTIL